MNKQIEQGKEKTLTALIVHEHETTALVLADLFTKQRSVKILKIFASHEYGWDSFGKLNPDIVFIEVQNERSFVIMRFMKIADRTAKIIAMTPEYSS